MGHQLVGNLRGERGIEPASHVDRRQFLTLAGVVSLQFGAFQIEVGLLGVVRFEVSRPTIRRLQYYSDRKPDARIPTVVKVVPVVIIDVKVITIVPVLCPGFRPGIHEHERKAAV